MKHITVRRARKGPVLAAAYLVAAQICGAGLAKADEDTPAAAASTATSARPADRVLFSGADVNGDTNLWFTDGTAAGTIELTHIGFGGIQPTDITAFGTGALFQGLDIGTGNLTIWTTDGTAKGTHELKIAGTPPGDLSNGFSPNITSIGGKALFAKFSISFDTPTLWVTDGTSAGTKELSPTLVDPQDITRFGGKGLFGARTASGGPNSLWITDGTAKGTRWLTSIPVDPSEITVLGQKAVFRGTDANGHRNLWVTDGTRAGTRELRAFGQAPDGLVTNLIYSDLTLFGGQVLFAGGDAGGRIGLWTTNGTSAGTRELKVRGTSSSGLFTIEESPVFGVVGKKALFWGLGAGTVWGLWVTDRTSAGTHAVNFAGFSQCGFHVLGSKVLFVPPAEGNWWVTSGSGSRPRELKPLSALPSGLLGFQVCAALAITGGEGFFQGEDKNERAGLWITDGTSAGTRELGVARAAASGLKPEYLTVLRHLPKPPPPSPIAADEQDQPAD